MCDKAVVTLERNHKLYDQLVAKYPECANMWKWFCSITEIPRPSGHTKKAEAWAQEAGRKVGGTVKVDAVGNVHVFVPATPGFESKPAVVLQAHLDMVPTQAADVKHNFAEDPIHAWVDGDLLRARGTTLGADDGSGVAAILALAEDKKLKHGPMELLFTVDEEIGLVGAGKLKAGELLTPAAKYLINVDSEDWGEITLSSAGGVDRQLVIPVHRAPLEAATKWSFWELDLFGFKGGHSGVEIHVGRANAVKWAAKMLSDNMESQGGCVYRIVDLKGGNAHNAIPSKCTVEVAVPAEKGDAFFVACSNVFHTLVQKWSHVEKIAGQEPQFRVKRLEKASRQDALTWSSSRTVMRFIESVHHGVWKYSEEVPTLVETSQSCSVVKLRDTEFELEVFARSSNNHALAIFPKLLEDIAALYGGSAKQYQDDSPGWPAMPESRLCQSAVKVFKTEFKAEPKLVPIHAGLECGIIMAKFPNNKLEAISVGPTVRSPHTTDEHMVLDSAAKLYHFLAKLVEDLAN